MASDQRGRIAQTLADAERHEAFGDREGFAECGQVLAELAVRRVERRSWDAQRGADPTRKLLGIWPVIGPDVQEPFSKLVGDGVIHLPCGQAATQMNDGIIARPHQCAPPRELSALSQTDATVAEQRDGELYTTWGTLGVCVRALVDLADGEVRNRISQSIALLPHLLPPAMSCRAP
ncbi:MAG TPA: hypothetical protein VJN18_00485 [Polyangiaceae bacterium]|nr:hypothetical protein [Polyangiaceae bacterium]